MVNAKKHQALLNDKPTRVNKRINKVLCLSNNAKQKDENENRKLMANGGNVGKQEINNCLNKRKAIYNTIVNPNTYTDEEIQKKIKN